MTAHSLPLPSESLVISTAQAFDADPRYGPSDRALASEFSRFPLNDTLEEVLIKVVLLNTLYNTNVFAVVEMAAHIRDLAIDQDLSTASPALVDKIARLSIRGKERRHYSFATKYCSWHNPNDFPIYDGLVDRVLWLYQKEKSYAHFSRPELQDYVKFKAVLAAFRQRYGLAGISAKQLDKFLWYTAKRLRL